MFGGNQNQNPFGAPQSQAAPFGGAPQTQSAAFGNPFGGTNTTATLFGGTTTTSSAGGAVFGQTTPAFGQSSPGQGVGPSSGGSTRPSSMSTGTTGGFGQTTGSTAPLFGQTDAMSGQAGFGSHTNSAGISSTGTGGFGQSAGSSGFGTTYPGGFSTTSAGGLRTTSAGGFATTGVFGTTTAGGFGTASSGGFGTTGGLGTTTAGGFGTTSSTLFGTSPQSSTGTLFGTGASTGSGFGTTSSGSSQTTSVTSVSSGMFGETGNLFAQGTGGSGQNLFGAKPSQPPAYSPATPSHGTMFGGQTGQPSSQGSLFGKTDKATEKPAQSVVFGGKPGFGGGASSTQGTADGSSGAQPPKNIFGAQSDKQQPTSAPSNPFGGQPSAKNAFSASSGGPVGTGNLFGPGPSGQTLFGKPTSASGNKAIFGLPDEKQKTFGSLGESEITKTPFGQRQEEKGKKLPGTMQKAMEDDNKDQPSAPRGGLFGKDIGSRPRSTSPKQMDKDIDSRVRSTSPVAIRRGVNRERGETRPKPAPGLGLFGKAIAGVASSRDSKPSGSQGAKDSGQQTAEYVALASKDEKIVLKNQRVLQRRSTMEEIKQKVALVCRNVPQQWNMKERLKKHFSRYAAVTRVFPNPNKGQATIHFKTHEDADNAKKKGRVLGPGIPAMSIFWSSFTPNKQSPGQDSKPSPITFGGGSRLGAAPPAERRAIASQALQSELDDELSTMAGPSDISKETAGSRKPRPALGVWSSRDAQGQGQSSRMRPRPSALVSSSAKAATSKAVKSTAAKAAPKPPQAPKVEKGVSHISLRELSAMVGQCSQERYEILDSRDKLVKTALGISKHADLETAQVIKGTCQDMCPEKERYMREYRNGLHLYEMVPGTWGLGHGMAQVDHMKAVKEYSRSSADQDMPLPHELRPPPVLERTMNYLISNIMDLGEDGKWGDWYDFLWNRTRGIRKEIIQLQLYESVAVSLVEKCARFHIYCSERLCGEDSMVFDERINSENLTKCLQTLKEMYTDLAEKKGEFCQTEAEFRAYLVLLNLNQGDILRESQQLRPEVRESPLVRFSMTVHTALNCNNYVKFFKLVKQAPFLCACLMHRYFNQVRGRALRTMLRAYKGTSGAYPLSNLVKQLGFESEDEAGQFCVHHGVQVADGAIPVGKSKFIEPEEAFPPQRAVGLVESKQTESIGETINGGPVPTIPIPQPSTSFDGNGRLAATEIQVAQEEDTLTTTTGESPLRETPVAGLAPKVLGSPQRPSQVPETTPQEGDPAKPVPVPNEMVKEIARELFYEIIEEFVVPMSKNIVQAAQVYLSLDRPFYEDIQTETLRPLIKAVCEETKEDQRSELAESVARERAEVSARKARVTQDITNMLTAEVATELSMEVAQEEARTVEAQLDQASQERVTMVLCEELAREVALEQTVAVGEDVYQTDVVDRLAELEECRQATELLRVARFYRKWKDVYHRRLRLKNSMTTFPPAPSLLSHSDQFDALLPESQGLSHNALHLGGTAHLTFDTPAEVLSREDDLAQTISVYNHLQNMRRERAWRPYQDIGRVWRHLQGTDVNWKSVWEVGRLKWKLVISMPEDTDDPMTSMLNKWVRAKFRRGTVPNSDSNKTDVLSLYSQSVEGHWPVTSVSVCVREVKGLVSQDDLELLEEKRHLLGTSGILFVLDPTTEQQDLWEEAAERLLQLVQAKPPVPCLPLVVVCHNTVDPNLVVLLNLEFLVLEGLVSQYEIVCVPENVESPQASKELLRGVRWLEQRCPPPPKLTSLPLRDYIEDGLSEHFFTPVYTDLHRRRKQQLLHQSPDVQISLFNAVVAHIAAKSSDVELGSISWPITELSLEQQDQCLSDWNKEDQLAYIEQCVLSLSLPQFDSADPDSESWADACQDVWEYVGAVVEEEGSNAVLYSRVRWLIQKVEEDFSDLCCLSLREMSCTPRYVNMPWTDIILACVDHKLSNLDYTDPGGEEDNETRELQVHTLISTPSVFTPPEDWVQGLTGLIQPDAVHLQDTLLRSVKRKREESGKRSPPKQPRYDLNTTYIDLTPVSQMEVERTESAHQLKQKLAEEILNNKQFEDYLSKVLNEDVHDSQLDIDSLSDYNIPVNGSVTSRDFDDVMSGFHGNRTVRQTPRRRKRTSLPDTWTPVMSAYKARTMTEEPMVPGLSEDNTSNMNASLLATRRRQSLADDVKMLNTTLGAQKTADKLFEMKLKSYLIDMPDFMQNV